VKKEIKIKENNFFFISIQSNLCLLEYSCCILQKVFENGQQRPPNEERSVRPLRSS
jgi:hypothetical protein